MRIPNQSYIIHYTPRTGSTYLSEWLKNTGIAGQPEELFTVHPEEEHLAKKYGVSNFAAFRQRIWEMGTSTNGVFSSKGSPGLQLTKLLSIFPDIPTEEAQTLYEHLFPNVRYIHLTRRNKVRQAISWWVAIKSEQWHQRNGPREELPLSFWDDAYDFAALSHLFKEASLRECAIEDFLSTVGITAHTVVYEDMVLQPRITVNRILQYLDLPIPEHELTPPNIYPTATARSEIWVERFKADIQKGMDVLAWS